MSATVDYIEIVRDFLGGEEGRLFAQRARQYGMAEDGPELLPLVVLSRAVERSEVATAATTERLAAFERATSGFSEVLNKLKEELVRAVGGEIEEKIVQSIDDLQRETASMARALAHSEFTAAATVRSRAISEEVGELRRQAVEFARSGGGSSDNGAAAAGGPGDVDEGGGIVFTIRELTYLVAAAAGVGGVAGFLCLLAAHAFHA